ncbi:hypothetical protein E4U39_004578 [Claviceps sp. Clav50 group G5]|nr:hypothetical protein E4U39_004578 [Claviceps sp. Clav50 group G5]
MDQQNDTDDITTQQKDRETQEDQEQTKMLKQQTDANAMQDYQEQTPEVKRILLQPTTLDEYIKEWHASTFSKLTIDSNGPQRDPPRPRYLVNGNQKR